MDKSRLIKKQYARRNLSGYRSPYTEVFKYRSIVSVGIEEVCKLMSSFVDVRSDQNTITQARIKLDELIEFAGTLYNPNKWLVAFMNGNPIGYVFPQRYWDKPEEGSIFDIAVLPESQGRGYGKILHAKGLELLAEMGAKEYVGSTDVENIPMIAIFLANGCKLTKIHTIKFYGYDNQRIIKSE